MDMTTKQEITELYIDLNPAEVKGIVAELETLFKANGLDTPEAAKNTYPNLYELYNGLYNTYMVSTQEPNPA